MHHHYDDIRDLTEKEPLWWDECAVPRYCEFEPDAASNIYANNVVLFTIACQSCGRRFNVCLSESVIDTPSLQDAAREGWLGYGDPPNIRCCPAGPTMSSFSLYVSQFWTRKLSNWRRVPELEVGLEDG